MKLRNKKTGIIGELHFEPDKEYHFTVVTEDPADVMIYKKLAALYADWEDYEEPKSKYLYVIDPIRINFINEVYKDDEPDWCEQALELGMGFENKEEAEQAVRRLKAWKRLKDKGFRFEGIKQDYTRFFSQQKPIRIGRKYLQFNKAEDEEWLKENCKDLDLLFGGKK